MPKRPASAEPKPTTAKQRDVAAGKSTIKRPDVLSSPAPGGDPSVKVKGRPIVPDHRGMVTSQDAQRLIGKTDRTLRDWRAKGCPAIEDGGRVDIGGVIDWLVSKVEAEAEADKKIMIDTIGGGEMTLAQIEAGRELTQWRIDEAKLAKIHEDYILRKEIYHVFSLFFADINTKLRRLPGELADILSVKSDPGEVESLINDACENIITQLNIETLEKADQEVDLFADNDDDPV